MFQMRPFFGYDFSRNCSHARQGTEKIFKKARKRKGNIAMLKQFRNIVLKFMETVI